jgi:AraC-like DNA-binding protein
MIHTRLCAAAGDKLCPVDLITEVVATARAGQAAARRIRMAGPWGMRFPAFAGAGFHAILEGSCWLVSPAGPPRQLSAGDLVLAAAGAEHGLSDRLRPFAELPPMPLGPIFAEPETAEVTFLCGAYRLERGNVHPYLRELPDIISVRVDPAMAALVDLLGDDTAATRPGAEVTRPALIDLLLVHVLRAWQETSAGWPPAGDPSIAAALREIHRDPAEQWTIPRLSTLAGLSRTAFTRRFTTLTGKPPMTYVLKLRLTTAARLLRESEAPLAAVARQVGYTSEFAFAGAFRREYGIAPGRFRQSRGRLFTG